MTQSNLVSEKIDFEGGRRAIALCMHVCVCFEYNNISVNFVFIAIVVVVVAVDVVDSPPPHMRDDKA